MPLPDVINAEMTKEDITNAVVRFNEEHGGVCATCPVATVLHRMYPDWDWSVGYSSLSAEKGDEHLEFSLQDRTTTWIRKLGHSPEWHKSRPHGKFTIRLMPS